MAGSTGSYDCSFLDEVITEGRVTYSSSHLEQYSQDASPHAPSVPDAVVWPTSTDEVAAVLAGATERHVPVTPRAGGSGLEGNAIPVDGGIVCNLAEMTDLTIRPDDLEADVQAGVVYGDLNERAGRYGLRFPPGISSGDVATIGGMIATNASGFNAVRYGETRDHVRSLEVVLADGRVRQFGRNVVKTSAGYSLKDLFIGSEGTLGIVTEATVALTGIPERRAGTLVTFDTVSDASKTVTDIIQFGINPGALEFMDGGAISYINAYREEEHLEAVPTLIIELHANNDGIEEDLALVKSICEANGATGWDQADASDRRSLWAARRDAYPAFEANVGREVLLVGDVVVPISAYPALVETVNSAADDLGIPCPCVGHAGDGNLHYNPLVDPDDADSVAAGRELNDHIISFAIEQGGSITGEHGIGIGKRAYMADEHGDALEEMHAMKELFDPDGILNPGKVLPTPTDADEADH